MKATHKKLIAAGGIKCPCCTPWNKKKTLTKLNRAVRRATNRIFKAIPEGYENEKGFHFGKE